MIAVQGSVGWVQSHGAQLVPEGQAGQTQTDAGDVAAGAPAVADPAGAAPLPVAALPVAFPPPVPPGTVMVVVEAAPQLQLHGAHAAPGGQAGHAQVQVPLPVAFPAPLVVPQPPPAPRIAPPPPAPPPVPQSHLHGGQAWPGAQAGQAQVQVPPPALDPPPS